MKIQMLLNGLDCGVCASEIEREVGRIDGVFDASVNFASGTLTVDIPDEQKQNILRQVERIAHQHDSLITVSEKTYGKPQPVKDAVTVMPYISLLISSVAFTAGLILTLSPAWEFGLFFAAYLAVGGKLLFTALRNIIKGQIFDENFLMSIATIGAFIIGEYAEGAAVMLFYQIGEMFQTIAVNRSRKSIEALMDIRPDYANLKTGDTVTRVSPEKVSVADVIIVKAGEKIPLDGKVLSGSSSLDTSALTGESMPRDVKQGSEVLSGSVNLGGLLTVKVTKEFGESTVMKILDLVQNAGSKKATTEKFITGFARIYTPIVVFSALGLAVVPPLLLPGAAFAEWINRALIFLVVSCPCALVVSIPLSYFGGIGGASRNGILIKGSSSLDVLSQLDTVVFDKTGTLTKGVFKVSRIVPAEGQSKDAVLSVAAHAECFSNHPIAGSILKAYPFEIDKSRISEYEEIAGLGLRAVIDGKEILAGNIGLMSAFGIDCPENQSGGTVVYLVRDNRFLGYILIEDEIRQDSRSALSGLRAQGVKKIVMLTGDRPAAAEKAAEEIGLNDVYAGLLPHQKVEMLERLLSRNTARGKLAFVGDGINDAPVLARADLGIAMGGLGSDAAIEAADVVLMTDQPSKLVAGIRIAKKTRRIVWQNIILALGIKAVILLLGALGFASMWGAVFADVGVTIIAVINAIRTVKLG